MNAPGKLYLIPSVLFPDTQAEVLPPMLPEVIKTIKYFLVENERTARRFISSLKTGLVIDELQFVILDKDTPAMAITPVLELTKLGHAIGVISEAGCPGIADPGAIAVAAAHQKNIEVVPLVGPSSVLLALMGSGFNGQRFIFNGYLPIDRIERQKAIKSLEKEAHSGNQTQIFIETPYRNNALLSDVVLVCNPATLLCVAADLTGATQFLKTRKIGEWKKELPDLNKRPAIFLFGNY